MHDTLYINEVEEYALPNSNPKQLVVFLHGLGADGNDLISLAPEFASILPDAHFLSPHAPFPCDMAPFGRQWFSLQNREEEAMCSGLATAHPLLMSFLKKQCERFSLPLKKVILIGFSQGTMLSLYSGLREYCGAILGYSGALVCVDHYTENTTQHKPPICLIHGTDDSIVPYSALAKAEDALHDLGINVETHTRPGLGHGIDGEGIAIGRRFLQGLSI